MEEFTTMAEDAAKEILNHIASNNGTIPKDDIFPVERLKDLCITLHDYKPFKIWTGIHSDEDELDRQNEFNKMFPEFISALQSIWNGGFLLSTHDKKYLINSLRDTLALAEGLARNKKEIYQIVYPGEKVPKIFR